MPLLAEVDWLALVQTFGVAVAILVAVGLAAVRVAQWTAREIILPIRDKLMGRFLAFFDKIEETVAKVDRNVDQMTDTLERQSDSLSRMGERLDRLVVHANSLEIHVPDKRRTHPKGPDDGAGAAG